MAGALGCGGAESDTSPESGSAEASGPAPTAVAPISASPALDSVIGQLPFREGFVEVEGGRVWYRIVGFGDKTPLLLLHGGPGAPSYYLEMLAALGDERPVVFYDQLGAGRSDMPSDTTLWTIERFVRELALVREALDLDRVHILGQSWGTMLAVDYMLTRPVGVESLILSSPALSIPSWIADTDSLLRLMPPEVQEVVRVHEEAGTTDSPEYMEATMEFYGRHLARRHPWPAQMDSVFARFGGEVYGYMWGPSEFHATGTLRTYDRTDRLGELDLPVLFVTGRYDEATPATVERHAGLVPGAKLVIMENSAHMTMLDEPELNVQVVRDFLREVEGN
jgi:proline iminopeptidase